MVVELHHFKTYHLSEGQSKQFIPVMAISEALEWPRQGPDTLAFIQSNVTLVGRSGKVIQIYLLGVLRGLP